MPGVRTGLKLKSIDGDAVVDHASAMAAIADGHRPMTLVLVEDNARIAKNKLKTAIKLGGMRKAKTPAVEKEEDIVVELHQHVIVNGKPWEVVELDSPPGMAQLQLVGGTMRKRWPRERVQHALDEAAAPAMTGSSSDLPLGSWPGSPPNGSPPAARDGEAPILSLLRGGAASPGTTRRLKKSSLRKVAPPPRGADARSQSPPISTDQVAAHRRNYHATDMQLDRTCGGGGWRSETAGTKRLTRAAARQELEDSIAAFAEDETAAEKVCRGMCHH